MQCWYSNTGNCSSKSFSKKGLLSFYKKQQRSLEWDVIYSKDNTYLLFIYFWWGDKVWLLNTKSFNY